jgi:hypothetical protein
MTSRNALAIGSARSEAMKETASRSQSGAEEIRPFSNSALPSEQKYR